MKDHSIKRLAVAGVLAAGTVLLTVFASIPMPGGQGYINLGDVGVLFSAYMLGGGWGFLCAGLASALADVLLGWSIYAPASFVIKGSVALLAGVCFGRIRGRGRSFFVYPAALLVPLGYGLYETMLFGMPVAAVNLLPNVLQCLVGGALAQGLIAALPKRMTLFAAARHAAEERARMARDPKGGADVVLIARDEALALSAGDYLSVQGKTARVLVLDDGAAERLAALLPAGIPALRHDGRMSAVELAKQAMEAIGHDL